MTTTYVPVDQHVAGLLLAEGARVVLSCPWCRWVGVCHIVGAHVTYDGVPLLTFALDCPECANRVVRQVWLESP